MDSEPHFQVPADGEGGYPAPEPPPPPPADEPPFGEPAYEEPPTRRPGPRGFTVLAWLVIVGMCAAMVGLHYVTSSAVEAEPNAPDRIGVMMMKIQGQYMAFAADLQGDGQLVYDQSKPALNIGSIGQRQRFVVLAGELIDPAEAMTVLEELEGFIDDEIDATADSDTPFVPTEEQLEVNRILHEMMLIRLEAVAEAAEEGEQVEEASIDLVATMSADDRALLVEQLGWFGELAFVPPETSDEQAREDVFAPARRLGMLIVVVAILGFGAGAVGFLGLIIFAVLMFTQRIPSRIDVTPVHPGIYAETFAIWLLLFVGLQVPAGGVVLLMPDLAMLIMVIAFFASLLALVWPVLRGVPWRQVRADIGLTLGTKPLLEPFVGLGGYLLGLPMLGVGVLITFGLMVIQQATVGEPARFGSSAGPAHPIVEQLAGGAWGPRIQVLLLAAVAAPIVEETMFRGVLYRHLRDVSRGLGIAASIVLSAGVSGFVFAAIHPQGWVAIPALMSLACAFVLVREWRGTIIPAMVIHGVSNGLVMTLLMLLLSA